MVAETVVLDILREFGRPGVADPGPPVQVSRTGDLTWTDAVGGTVHAETALPAVPSATSTYRRVNGVRLHVVAAGDRHDPLVVLLHGFPDFWYGWRHHVAPLVEAGYRVLVPDQRGYDLSEKPRDVAAYRIEEPSRDVVELVGAAGRDAAHVVGHDWGAAVAWDLALRHPGVVDRLCVLNGPHPTAYRRAVRTSPRQVLRSSYGLFVQVPRLPEWLFGWNDYATAAQWLRRSATPGAFTDADLDRYRAAWDQDGAPTAMLNWYRAAARYGIAPPRERVEAPTLIVWGERDPALLPELAPLSLGYCADGRLEQFPAAGHWVHLDEPEPVAELLVEHLAG